MANGGELGGEEMISSSTRVYHRPVMVAPVIHDLNVRPGGRYIDATVGEGGHASAIMEAAGPLSRLMGLDADPQALAAARERLRAYQDNLVVVHTNFSQLVQVAQEHAFIPVDGILLDLGFSSLQLEGEGRGFSFQREEPLDMRFDPHQELTAADIVNGWPLEELAHIIASYGEERRARPIARAIVDHRPLHTAQALAQVVQRASGYHRGRTHPATRTFQALRIAVNRELEALEAVLPQAVSLLQPGGRLVIISYHSLEDRRVKEFLRRESRDCLCPPETPVCQCEHRASLRPVTRKVTRPTSEEVQENPRSRSARLRGAQRL